MLYTVLRLRPVASCLLLALQPWTTYQLAKQIQPRLRSICLASW